MSMDINVFKNAMSKFATGVTVVTTKYSDEIYGLTVNAFCSVSLRPPLVLICIEKQTTGHNILLKSKTFAVNMLSGRQKHLSQRFSNPALPPKARFDQLQFTTGETGAPIFDGILGFVECRQFAVYDGGDHSIIVGEVLAAATSDGNDPLLYFDRQYNHLPTETVS